MTFRTPGFDGPEGTEWPRPRNEGQKRSQRQEREWADALDGQTTPGSGNTWARKNDVRSGRWSLELKTTAKKQFPLKADDLRTAERHALMDGREFAFGIEMAGSTWMVMNAHDWYRMREDAGWF